MHSFIQFIRGCHSCSFALLSVGWLGCSFSGLLLMLMHRLAWLYCLSVVQSLSWLSALSFIHYYLDRSVVSLIQCMAQILMLFWFILFYFIFYYTPTPSPFSFIYLIYFVLFLFDLFYYYCYYYYLFIFPENSYGSLVIPKNDLCLNWLLFGLCFVILSVFVSKSISLLPACIHRSVSTAFWTWTCWYCQPLLNWKECKIALVVDLAHQVTYRQWDDVMIPEKNWFIFLTFWSKW